MVARLTVVSSDITDQDLVSVDPAVNAQYIALVRRHDPEAAEVANGLVVYLVYLDAAANEIVSAASGSCRRTKAMYWALTAGATLTRSWSVMSLLTTVSLATI